MCPGLKSLWHMTDYTAVVTQGSSSHSGCLTVVPQWSHSGLRAGVMTQWSWYSTCGTLVVAQWLSHNDCHKIQVVLFQKHSFLHLLKFRYSENATKIGKVSKMFWHYWRFERQWKSNQKYIFLQLILEQKSTPSWPLSSKRHHWGHTCPARL